jgi:hypothetical protein
MKGSLKLIAITIIWIAFTVVLTSSTSPVSNVEGDVVIWITMVLAAAAGGSTIAVTQARDTSEQPERSAEKSKRTRTRVGQFMDSLSDDEIAELRARLMDDDGEVMPLETLMTQRHEERGSR